MSIVVGPGIVIGHGIVVGSGEPAPPQPVMIITTESGDNLTTESGDTLTTE